MAGEFTFSFFHFFVGSEDHLIVYCFICQILAGQAGDYESVVTGGGGDVEGRGP